MLEGAKQRSLCSEGVLMVHRASKQVATKHNSAYNDFLKGEITMIKEIKIEGMHCPNCVAAVKRELEALEGVTHVDVSLEDAQAIVEVEEIADETLQEAIEDIGFDVVEIK